MQFDNARPIYLQIIDDYKKKIIRGELNKGDKIPSQREYAQQIRVNPNTVQRAYREMEGMNMVETLRGQGTFIVAGEEMKIQMIQEMAEKILEEFIKEMRSLGYGDKEITGLLDARLSGKKEAVNNDRV